MRNPDGKTVRDLIACLLVLALAGCGSGGKDDVEELDNGVGENGEVTPLKAQDGEGGNNSSAAAGSEESGFIGTASTFLAQIFTTEGGSAQLLPASTVEKPFENPIVIDPLDQEPPLPGGQGRLKLDLTDFPSDDLQQLLVSFSEVAVIFSPAGSTEEKKEVVSSDAREIDLLALRQGILHNLGLQLLPDGIISQIRLVLTSARGILKDGGTEVGIKVPSGEQSGLKLNGTIPITPGKETAVVLDFDAEKSLIHNQGQGYILKPVVKIKSVNQAVVGGFSDPNRKIIVRNVLEDFDPFSPGIVDGRRDKHSLAFLIGVRPTDAFDAQADRKDFQVAWDLGYSNSTSGDLVRTHGPVSVTLPEPTIGGDGQTRFVEAMFKFNGRDNKAILLPDGIYVYVLNTNFKRSNPEKLISTDKFVGMVMIDNTPPQIAFTGIPNAVARTRGTNRFVTRDPSLTITLEYSDNLSGVDLAQFRAFIDGGEVTSQFSVGPASATGTFTLADGLHEFTARIRDVAENETFAVPLVIRVDTVAPIVKINQPGNDDAFPTLKFTTDVSYVDPDPASGVITDTLSIPAFNQTKNKTTDITPSANQRGPMDVRFEKTLQEGKIFLNASIEDDAGNVGKAPQIFFYLDITLPEITVTLPFPDPTNTKTFQFTLDYHNGLSGIDETTVSATFNGQPVSFVSPPTKKTATSISLTNVEGDDAIVARVKDRAGNEGISTTRYLADFTPPVVTLSAPGLDTVNGVTRDSNFSLTLEARDNLTPIVDLQVFQNGIHLTTVATGSATLNVALDQVPGDVSFPNVFQVKARDAAGNSADPTFPVNFVRFAAPRTILVKFDLGVSPGIMDTVLSSIGATRGRTEPVSGLTEVFLPIGLGPDSALDQLRARDEVEGASLDLVVTLDQVPVNDRLPLTSTPFVNSTPLRHAFDVVDVQNAWTHTTGRNDQFGPLIAVLDTGVDTGHPDLAANIAPGGTDFVDNDGDPSDSLSGHGTAVAGIIGAIGNNGIGVAGINWRTRILPVRVIGSGRVGFHRALLLGLSHAMQQGATILNMSLSFTIPVTSNDISAQRERNEANLAVLLMVPIFQQLRDRGVLLVVSAGNQSQNLDSASRWPAVLSDQFDNILTVAATGPNDNLADFSNCSSPTTNRVNIAAPGAIGMFATTLPSHPVQSCADGGLGCFRFDLNGNLRPTLTAPGGTTTGTRCGQSNVTLDQGRQTGTMDYGNASQERGDIASGEIYGHFNGTSAAAPVVAGIAGLVASVRPGLTGQQIRDIILNSADQPASLNNLVQGSRRVNARRAVERAIQQFPDPPPAVGRRLYVANFDSKNVSVIGIPEGIQARPPIATAGKPSAVGWDRQRGRLMVASIRTDFFLGIPFFRSFVESFNISEDRNNLVAVQDFTFCQLFDLVVSGDEIFAACNEGPIQVLRTSDLQVLRKFNMGESIRSMELFANRLAVALHHSQKIRLIEKQSGATKMEFAAGGQTFALEQGITLSPLPSEILFFTNSNVNPSFGSITNLFFLNQFTSPVFFSGACRFQVPGTGLAFTPRSFILETFVGCSAGGVSGVDVTIDPAIQSPSLFHNLTTGGALTGALVTSLDQRQLFVALPNANAVDVFNLDSLVDSNLSEPPRDSNNRIGVGIRPGIFHHGLALAGIQ